MQQTGKRLSREFGLGRREIGKYFSNDIKPVLSFASRPSHHADQTSTGLDIEITGQFVFNYREQSFEEAVIACLHDLLCCFSDTTTSTKAF